MAASSVSSFSGVPSQPHTPLGKSTLPQFPGEDQSDNESDEGAGAAGEDDFAEGDSPRRQAKRRRRKRRGKKKSKRDEDGTTEGVSPITQEDIFARISDAEKQGLVRHSSLYETEVSGAPPTFVAQLSAAASTPGESVFVTSHSAGGSGPAAKRKQRNRQSEVAKVSQFGV